MELTLFVSLLLAVLAAIGVSAESHTIKFVNQCGYGTPALVYDGKNISNGQDYTTDAPFSGIAYLQTGPCLTNGENCALLEMTLINSVCEGCGSSTDISLIPPHAYNVETSFAYYNGCDGIGSTCADPTCSSAFFQPNDNQVQVSCQDDNVNLLIAFCANASDFVSGATPSTAPSSSIATISTSSSSSSTTSSATTSTSSSSSSATSSDTISTSSSSSAATSSATTSTSGSSFSTTSSAITSASSSSSPATSSAITSESNSSSSATSSAIHSCSATSSSAPSQVPPSTSSASASSSSPSTNGGPSTPAMSSTSSASTKRCKTRTSGTSTQTMRAPSSRAMHKHRRHRSNY